MKVDGRASRGRNVWLMNKGMTVCLLGTKVGDLTECSTMGMGGRVLSFSGGKRCHAELSCYWWDSQVFSGENAPGRLVHE